MMERGINHLRFSTLCRCHCSIGTLSSQLLDMGHNHIHLRLSKVQILKLNVIFKMLSKLLKIIHGGSFVIVHWWTFVLRKCLDFIQNYQTSLTFAWCCWEISRLLRSFFFFPIPQLKSHNENRPSIAHQERKDKVFVTILQFLNNNSCCRLPYILIWLKLCY